MDAIVTLSVPPELVRLLDGNEKIRVVDWADPTLDEPDMFDYHSPLLSVMRHIGIAFPDSIWRSTYINAKSFGSVKLPEAKFRIGICWASGNHGPNLMERRRVVPVHKFLPLTEIADCAVISLQKGENSGDICAFGMEGLIYDVSHRLDDFAATAEIIQCLDLVISVDSAVVHLAAAMGKPTIMLSPYTRCWRWWSNRSGWPWYNNMRIFSQSQDGSWNMAMEKAISTARGDMLTDIG